MREGGCIWYFLPLHTKAPLTRVVNGAVYEDVACLITGILQH